jgi:hypothetical protein
MKVFISWSGDTSRLIAEALREWLPMAIQAVKPYMSQRDNEAGIRWEGMVSAQLANSNFGILCLTPDNLNSAWLNFEAGALGKVVDEARVVPLLYKVAAANVARPLGMFMSKPLDEEGIKETLKAINNSLPEDRRIDPIALDEVSTAMWPWLKQKLDRVDEHVVSGEPQPRDSREMLEEVLDQVRSLAFHYEISGEWPLADASLRTDFSQAVHKLELLARHTAAIVMSNEEMLERIRDVFGYDGAFEVIGNRLILHRVPSLAVLNDDRRAKYVKLRRDLRDEGVQLVIPSVRRKED